MFERTTAVINKTVNDAKRLSLITDTIAQIVFILMYTYSLVVNLAYLPRLIIYACLLTIAIISFCFHLATLRPINKHAKRTKKKVQKGFKYSKWVIQVVAIGLSIYEMVTLNLNNLAMIIKVFTMVSFAVQVLCEICSIIIDRYFSLLRCAFTADVQPISSMIDTVNQLKNPKAFVAAAVDKPLKYIADKLTNAPPPPPNEPSKADKKDAKLNAEISALVEAQRQKNRAQRKDDAEDKSRSVREHWNTIVNKLRRKKEVPQQETDNPPQE